MTIRLTSWHIKVAAEAIAAAQFARCGFAVSVQYGADQPEYDLVVTREDRAMKVSVKGSQDGGCGLTQSFKRGNTYHGAIDAWLARHSPGTVLCFVQFKGVALPELPRMYLASPREVAERLRSTAKGRGDTILYETLSGSHERMPLVHLKGFQPPGNSPKKESKHCWPGACAHEQLESVRARSTQSSAKNLSPQAPVSCCAHAAD